MADTPLLTMIVTEKTGGGEKEEPPSLPPNLCFVPIHTSQDVIDLVAVSVEILEPVFGCVPIVQAAPTPFVFDLKLIGTFAKQIVARHDSAGEEMLCDPVAPLAVVKSIRRAAVVKDMDKQPPFGS